MLYWEPRLGPMSYWGKFWGCVLLSFVLVAADPASTSSDPNAEPGFIGLLGSLSCVVSFGFLFMALFASKSDDKPVIVVQQQPPQQVIVQQAAAPQQPQYRAPAPQPQYRAPPPPAREVAKEKSVADQRKQAHLDRGHALEMEGDLEGAIIAYELAEDFKQAQRVRWALGPSKEDGENGPSNVNISIGKVGDTSVKDSVITGSDDEI